MKLTTFSILVPQLFQNQCPLPVAMSTYFIICAESRFFAYGHVTLGDMLLTICLHNEALQVNQGAECVPLCVLSNERWLYLVCRLFLQFVLIFVSIPDICKIMIKGSIWDTFE